MLSQDGYTVQYGYTEGAEGQPGNWYVEVITPEGATLDGVHHDGRAAYAAARRLAARHDLTPVKVSGKGKRGETAPAPALTFGEALPAEGGPRAALIQGAISALHAEGAKPLAERTRLDVWEVIEGAARRIGGQVWQWYLALPEKAEGLLLDDVIRAAVQNDASDGNGGNDATSNPAPEGRQIPLPFGIVMWAAGQVCRRPTSTRPRRAEVYYPVTCPSCGAVRSLRGCDARKAEKTGGQCAHCQRRAAGRKGAARLAEVYGPDRLLEVIKARQLTAPSAPEKTVMAWLDAARLTYERQALIVLPEGRYLIDFKLPGETLIEVRGYWHKKERAGRDYALAAAWPGKVVFVDADQVTTAPASARAALLAALQGVNHV